MNLLTQLRIWWLKRKVTKALIHVYHVGESMDCGHALAFVVSARYRAACEDAEAAWRRLGEIDPTRPKGKLFSGTSDETIRYPDEMEEEYHD